jgi:hypothetical protein
LVCLGPPLLNREQHVLQILFQLRAVAGDAV